MPPKKYLPNSPRDPKKISNPKKSFDHLRHWEYLPGEVTEWQNNFFQEY